MHILYVITKSNFGGAQRYVYELSVAAKELGHTVAVACGGNGLLRKKLTAAEIQTFEIKSFQRDIHFRKEISAAFELANIIRTFDPHVVHLNSSKAGGTGALVARLLRIPKVIFTAHGWPFLEPRGVLWRGAVWFASYLTALFVHRVILVSKYDLRHANMPFVKRKCSVINTAVPEIAFKSREDARTLLFSKEACVRHQDDLWLITNAELNPNKNLLFAVDAVVDHNKKSEQKIFYSIMSDGELRGQLQKHIEHRDAEEHITLLGYVTDGRECLRAFDIFLLPSKKEGMPYALLEAGAVGLPSIASSTGGIPEIIEHEKTGLLIDPNKSETLIRALEQLADDKELRTRLGDVLQKKIVQHFTLKEMVEKTMQVYENS